MASSINLSFILFLACSIFVQQTIGELICETLPVDKCSFAIASSGKRCVLENYKNEQGNLDYTCKTSEVVVEQLAGYIETDQCVNSCGCDRQSVGISSDDFLAPHFTAKLCSPACYQNCPNIVDLYFNLAAGEGVYLPALCEKSHASSHRAMLELFSSSGAASGSVASNEAEAPAPAVYYSAMLELFSSSGAASLAVASNEAEAPAPAV